MVVIVGLFPLFRQLVWHVSRMSFHLEEHAVHVRRLDAILNLPEERHETSEKRPPLLHEGGPDNDGEVIFRNVTFSYEPNNYILHDFSMQVQPGQMIGIVGLSGAGKSTLANILVGLEVPERGEVLISGRSILDWNLDELRRKVAYVSQDNYLINGSIRHNIAYGIDEPTDSEITRALAAADLLDTVKSLPQGLETVVGEHGVELSGGQRQRLAIARAYLRNPDIFIFDETTASLDVESEARVQAAWQNLRKHKTVIVIAHRLNTIEQADNIVLLRDGRVVEKGTHGELLKHERLYAYFHREQAVTLLIGTGSDS